jgi:hypothetical protein
MYQPQMASPARGRKSLFTCSSTFLRSVREWQAQVLRWSRHESDRLYPVR